ncbi:hypothetical protein PB1_09702 [Bacillus methanolicus PB1]|uniref:Uncharacterized protein n=1 Tax=Bacillus methanolicus PB1 TaxID=997296 RepID=I3E2A4_BACMT|nr:hypothetical protein PB1_09702 [Bacillus methanolicus PB1]
MENETNTEVRKEKRKELRKWKKPLKLIREDFLPRLAKYNEQNETFGDRNSYSKTAQVTVATLIDFIFVKQCA